MFNVGDWGKLNSTLMVITKRRAQNKLVVSAIGEHYSLYFY